MISLAASEDGIEAAMGFPISENIEIGAKASVNKAGKAAANAILTFRF